MLFSNDSVAACLNDQFECSWESVRPVVRCEIDFGDGRKLTRTLNGNVAIYLCTHRGEVFDVIPGLIEPEALLARLKVAVGFDAALAALPASARAEAVRRYHQALEGHEGASDAELKRIAESVRRIPDMSKRMIEQPIKDALKAAARLIEAPTVRDASKHVVEFPIKKAIQDSLDEDTVYNTKKREPRVHALLAKRPLETPSSLTKTVYKEVLDFDLDDPWLGLAPYVLGGEPGRHEP